MQFTSNFLTNITNEINQFILLYNLWSCLSRYITRSWQHYWQYICQESVAVMVHGHCIVSPYRYILRSNQDIRNAFNPRHTTMKRINDIRTLPTGIICVEFREHNTLTIETFSDWHEFLTKYPFLYASAYKYNVWWSKVKYFLSRALLLGGFLFFLVWLYTHHGL